MNNRQERFWLLVAEMSPGYFALVMSTGIVSLACQLAGFQLLALALFWLNLAFYLILWGFLGLRLIFYPQQVWSDLQSHSRAVGFLTIVAGTCLLGSQCVILLEVRSWSVILLILGAGLELFFLYAICLVLITRPAKPSFADSLNGNWLLFTVSLQAVAILTCLVATQFPARQEPLFLISLILFLLGIMLYIVIITLIFYRLLFFHLAPAAFEPPYWITAGAEAITTLAGVLLVAHNQGSPLLAPLRQVILGLTILAWSVATFWIPLVALLIIWRHGVQRVKIAYAPAYWGMVFPLGMYTVCTWHLGEVIRFPALQSLAVGFCYIALTAWFLTLLGLFRFLWRSLARPTTAELRHKAG